MVVDLYEKPGCHLCEDAAAVVIAEVAAAGERVQLRRHNILDDATLQQRYGELIPVVVIDGVQHATWFVDPERFRSALQE